MPKFAVNIEETCSYKVVVEASDINEAKGLALDTLINAPDLSVFFVACSDREILNVKEITNG
jgi:hypothetical protein